LDFYLIGGDLGTITNPRCEGVRLCGAEENKEQGRKVGEGEVGEGGEALLVIHYLNLHSETGTRRPF